MADISQYLNEIAEAVYGEEVRWSIINAINAVDSDATGAVNTVNQGLQDLDEGLSKVDAAAENANNAADYATKTADNAAEEAVKIATEAGEEAKQTASDAGDEAVKIAQEAADSATQTASDASDEAIRIATEAGEEAKQTASDAGEEAVKIATEAGEEAKATAQTAADTADAAAEAAQKAAETGIKETQISYAGCESGTTPPEDGWSDEIPYVESGHFLWTRVVIVYNDDTTTTYYSVGRLGTEEYLEEDMKKFEDELQNSFTEWFDNIKDTLDEDTAGKLTNMVNDASDVADDAVEMIMTNTAWAWLMDPDGTVYYDPNMVGYIVSWQICDHSGSSGGGTMYPVGSIYMSVNSTSPAEIFGGVWNRLEDMFLLGAGSSYSAGSTGGESAVTLSTSELPSHTHSTPSHTHSIPSLSGTAASAGAHTHTVNARTDNTTGGSAQRIGTSSTYDTTVSPLSSSGSHTHSVTTNSSTTGSSSGTSGSTGNGNAHNNMPPYLAVYMWQRIA